MTSPSSRAISQMRELLLLTNAVSFARSSSLKPLYLLVDDAP